MEYVDYRDCSEEKYLLLEGRVAMEHCPDIYPCRKCGYPCVSGWICGNCKDENPYEE